MAPKAIVIGSGIGGSGAGALMAARLGMEVELYERNALIGGRFASYEREGFRLDIGCHAIGNSQRGTLGRILDQVGESVEWISTKTPVYFIGDRRYRFPKGMAEMGLGPEETGKLFRLFADIMTMEGPELARLDRQDLKSLLGRYTRDRRAETIFAFIAGMYFCVPLDQTPAGEWAHCQRELNANLASGYPRGGAAAVPEAYCRAIEKAGGRVVRKMGVRKILVESGRAAGAVLGDGTVRKADLVVSNADVKTTVLELVGPEHYRPEILRRIEGLKWAHCSFTIKVALDRPITNDRFLVYIRDFDVLDERERLLEGRLPETAPSLMVPVVSNMDPTAAPEGKQILYAGVGCWPDLERMRQYREQWKESCMNGLRRVYPEIDRHVLWVEATGPETIDRLFGEGGNVIGVAQTPDQVGSGRPPIVDPSVRGLYHCSADTGVHGIGGELAADAALRLYEHLKSARQG
ncbi:MAG: NAD(P)/FAD-dependent oxidoreductase [bacterium]